MMSMTGRYGTEASSHEQPACTFANAWCPRRCAAAKRRFARSPGPATESEYSKTFVETPPRETGTPHSLTVIRATFPRGSRSATGSKSSSGQPQSQTIARASGAARRIPSISAAFASATISAEERFAQRGHPERSQWDAQFVRFSSAEIV